MTDFRALCAELVDDLELCDWPYKLKEIIRADIDRARAALADGPAVPEGREPASVTGQPSDEAWDALVERAWDKYQTVGYQGERFMYDRDFDNALEFVRQGLTRWGTSNLAETRSSLGGMPTPVPADKGEVGELVRWLRSRAGIPASPDFPAVAAMLTRAADLLEQRHPAPVPVSERLPVGVEQALIKAECALSDIAEGEPEEDEGDADALLQWAEQRAATALSRIRPVMRLHGILTSEWPPLPAHALPIPHQQENAND